MIYHLKGMGQLQFSSQPQNVLFHLNLRCAHAKYATFSPFHITIDTFIYLYLQTEVKFKLLTEFNISVQFLHQKYSINVYEISDEIIQKIVTFRDLLFFFLTFWVPEFLLKNSKILPPQIQGAARQKLFCKKCNTVSLVRKGFMRLLLGYLIVLYILKKNREIYEKGF